MPIYEYACGSCHNRFEIRQKLSDPPLTTCAKCGQAVTKLISSPAIMFKGSGWYVTDYSDKLKPPSGEGGESKDKADAKISGAETKPAAAGAGNGTPSTTPPPSPASSSGESSSGGSQPSSPPPKSPSST